MDAEYNKRAPQSTANKSIDKGELFKQIKMEMDRKDPETKVIQPAKIWMQNIIKEHHSPQPINQLTKENSSSKYKTKKTSPQ